MNEPASSPVKAKAMVDQKTMSRRPVDGRSECAVIGVADPNRAHATKPMPMRRSIGIQVPIAPAAESHLPTSRPTMFMAAAMTRPIMATMMK